MSDVEKITFDNQNRRRAREFQNEWERKAVENARTRDKQRCVRSWMYFLTYCSYMAFGATISLSAVFAAMGDFGKLATSITAAFIAVIGGLILSEKIER